MTKTNVFQVAAFYKFYDLVNLENTQKSFHDFLSKQKIKGADKITLLIAKYQ